MFSREPAKDSGSVSGCPRECGCEHILISRGQPDPNRHRTSVVTQVHRTRLKKGLSPDDYLARLGFSERRSHLLDVDLYHRNEYVIELTKTLADFPKRLACGDDDESRKIRRYFLVKAYVEDRDPVDGEKILNNACLDLEDDLVLVKPSLDQF